MTGIVGSGGGVGTVKNASRPPSAVRVFGSRARNMKALRAAAIATVQRMAGDI